MSKKQPKKRGQGTDGSEGENVQVKDSRRTKKTDSAYSAEEKVRRGRLPDVFGLILTVGGLAGAVFVLLIVGAAWIAAHYRQLLGPSEILLVAFIAILVVAYPAIHSVYRKGLKTTFEAVKRLCSKLAVLFGLLLLAMSGSWFYTWLTSPVPLKVGPETTFVEGPMRKDGKIDYLAAINQRASQGVRTKNNSLASIARFIPPQEWQSQAVRNRVFQKLGVKKPATNGVVFESFKSYAENQAQEKNPGAWGERVKPEPRERSNTSLGHREVSDIPAPKRPRWEVEWNKVQKLNDTWTEAEFPLVAEWLTAQKKVLDRVGQAIRRKKSWWPYVAPPRKDGLLTAVDLSHLETLKSMALASRLRALKHLPTGQSDRVIQDVLTIKHIARHLRDAPMLIEQLTGIGMATYTSVVIAELLEKNGVGGQEARDLQKRLATISGRFDIARSINVGERFRALDTLQRIPQGDIQLKQPGLPVDAFIESSFVERLVNCNRAMKRANRFYNRIVEAMRNPLYSPHINLNEKMMRYQADLFPPSFWRGSRLLFGHRGEITDVAYERAITILVPALSVAVSREREAAMLARLERVAVSIYRYHAKNGRYPKSLEALTPNWIDSVPKDMLAADESRPIQYRLEEGRVAVYSVGENEKDNGGMKAEDEDEGDLVIQWDRSEEAE